MLELFPELKDFSDMNFREPSKKTKGRFKSSYTRPDPLEPRLRSHALFQERIHRSVIMVADASMRLVPALLPRLLPIDERVEAEKQEINRRLYLRMSNTSENDLSSIRVVVMKELIQTRLGMEPSSVKKDKHSHRLAKSVSSPMSSNFWTDDVSKKNLKLNLEKYLGRYQKPIELGCFVETSSAKEVRTKPASMHFS
jgi:hypothetical protein